MFRLLTTALAGILCFASVAAGHLSAQTQKKAARPAPAATKKSVPAATKAPAAASTKTSPPKAASEASPQPPPDAPAFFVDQARRAGLTVRNVFGGETQKKYIIETTGSGVAVIDYDNDGWPDLFFPNGSTLAPAAGAKPPSSQLFRNNHDGTFNDVTDAAGLRATGWGQAACVGDYDNDGFDDLYVTYYGQNRLYHNEAGKRFHEVPGAGGAAAAGRAWSTGCAFVDYDRDGLLDIVAATYVDFDLATAPKPGEGKWCTWKGVAVMCGPRGLPSSKNLLFHNLGNGKFLNVSAAAGIEKTNGHY